MILKVGNLLYLTDYFVICSGDSLRQVKRIADAVRERMREKDIKINGTEGEKDGRWILLDYGDVVVHVFNQEDRNFYEIERLWKDAPLIEWEDNSEIHTLAH